jgi:O-antigen/teichoic acid export membrane protein
MSSIKKLASQTVIYGLTTIFARLLNFALTPLHTGQIEKAEYGVLNDLYSMIAFLMVVLTFGMETAFFKFYNDKKYGSRDIFSHTVLFTLFLSIITVTLCLNFLEPLAVVLHYEDRPYFIVWMLLIVAMDALAAVPFAKLRAENKPLRFLAIRLGAIALMVSLNLIFFLLFPYLKENGLFPSVLNLLYKPEWGVAYVFIANLIGNGFMILLFLPDFFQIRFKLKPALLKELLIYSSPLVIGFLAGISNEKAQYQFMKYLLPDGENDVAMGVFGAMMKIATFMMLFIQAFRFAAEPFFFSGEGDLKNNMARVLKYFVMVQSLIFLGLVSFTSVLKWTHFIDEKYWEGWSIVPVLLFANLLLGINFNLNIWYKLKNKTRMGAYISFFGLAFTVGFNLLLVPKYGYSGAAWATLISYAAMTAYSYYLNQKHDPIDYPIRTIGMYLGLALIGAYLSFYIFDARFWPGLIIFSLYLVFMLWIDGRALLKLRKS